MKRRTSPQFSANSGKYREAFIRHVHSLVYLGFERMDRKQLREAAEPDISGALCEAIEQVLDDPESDDWVDDYEIHDDPPVHDAKRKGKRRRRVDLRLASRIVRPRLRFCFEAKVLGPNNGAGKYFGHDGLGRFIDGSYAAEAETSGMLGYVQSDDCDTWAEKLSAALDSSKHHVSRNGKWTLDVVVEQLTHTFRTKHRRIRKLPIIEIFHTLLGCN